MYIAIEGIDGCGKSTIANALNNLLLEEGHDVQRVWEPGSTPIGEVLRKIVKSEQKFSETISPITEVLLFNASRIQMLENVVAPALKAGKIVLSDRCYLSTRAYQGYGRYMRNEVSALESLIPEDLKPNLIIYLDVGLETAKQRRSVREEDDRIEASGDEFFSRVRDCYRTAAHINGDLVKKVNGNAPVDEVLATVVSIVREYL